MIHYISNPLIVNIVERHLDEMIPTSAKQDIPSVILSIDKSNIISQPSTKQAHVFDQNIYLLYNINNQIYFDIHHILSCMELTMEQYLSKFHQYFDRMHTSIWDTNRLLIDFRTAGNLILSEDNQFSRIFKRQCFFCFMIIELLLYYSVLCFIIN